MTFPIANGENEDPLSAVNCFRLIPSILMLRCNTFPLVTMTHSGTKRNAVNMKENS